MEQKTLFKTVRGKVIVNNYLNGTGNREPPQSKTIPITVKLTDEIKSKIKEHCFEHDLSYSEFLRDAACFYYDFFKEAEKLIKYRQAIKNLLDSLD